MSLQQDARYTFETFVVGPGNRMAAAAARRAAEAPRTAYNPLFVYGGSGLGKTHLLRAVAELARAVRPDIRILFLTADELVDRASAALAGDGVEAFHDELLDAEVLLLDDAHLLSGKQRTQEELVAIWNELEARAQVVLAGAQAPAEIPGLSDEFRARIGGGLVVDVPPPAAETRAAIVARAAEERGVELGADVASFLAAEDESGRALIARVDRVAATQADRGRPLTSAETAALFAAPLAREAALDEFSSFLTDIAATVEAIVETEPWRKRLAEAILRWEGEGFRTRRLEEALEADSAPDVDSLLQSFASDVEQLRRIAGDLEALGSDSVRSPALRDPGRVGEAEALLLSARAAAERKAEDAARNAPQVDRWYFNPEKVAWGWHALEDRLVEEMS